MKKRLKTVWLAGVAAVAGGIATSAADADAAGPASAASFVKPAWLPEVSFTVKQSRDENVFLSGVNAQFLPPVIATPAGSVAALKDHGSWVTTLSPKISLDGLPLLGEQTVLRALSLSYAPDFVIYENAPSENFSAHRVSGAVKGRTDSLSFAADSGFVFIDGNQVGPIYPGNFLSALGTAAPRERREQIQNRAKATIQYDTGNLFFRASGTLLYYNLQTALLNIPGYQNYADRCDVNGGPDVGYRLNSAAAVTVGYRHGHQYQQQFSFSPYNSSSDYQRVLAGLESEPWPWLTVALQGGPDFRSYEPNTATHIAPVNHLHLTTYYGEATLTAQASPDDMLAFKYKQFQWVSSIGKTPYFDSCYDLTYARRLTSRASATLGAKLLGADYTSGNLATCQRNDLQYTLSVGAHLNFAGNLGADVGYSIDFGHNAMDGIANPQTREYRRQLISFGIQWKL